MQRVCNSTTAAIDKGMGEGGASLAWDEEGQAGRVLALTMVPPAGGIHVIYRTARRWMDCDWGMSAGAMGGGGTAGEYPGLSGGGDEGMDGGLENRTPSASLKP